MIEVYQPLISLLPSSGTIIILSVGMSSGVLPLYLLLPSFFSSPPPPLPPPPRTTNKKQKKTNFTNNLTPSRVLPSLFAARGTLAARSRVAEYWWRRYWTQTTVRLRGDLGRWLLLFSRAAIFAIRINQLSYHAPRPLRCHYHSPNLNEGS